MDISNYRYFCNKRSLRINGKIKWKIIISSITLIMFVLILMPVVSSVDSDLKFNVSIKSNELDNDNIKIRTIEASNHYKYGKKAVDEYPYIFKLLKRLCLADYILNWQEIHDNIKAWNDDETGNFEDYLKEFDGIKDKLFITRERVLSMGRWLDEPFPFLKQKLCTTTAATNHATSSKDATFIHQNIDNKDAGFIWENILSKTINVAKIDGEYDYAFWGYPILSEWPFLNEKDVGFVGNGLRLDLENDDDIDTSDALTNMPPLWLTRRSMMDCDRVIDPQGQNLSDVRELWQYSKRASGKDKIWPHSWDGMSMIWCDGFGDILAIEQTRHYFASKTETENEDPTGPVYLDILWHSNHHMWLDPDLTGSIEVPDEDWTPKSGERGDRAYELLSGDNYGNLNYEFFEESIAKDHYGYPDAICSENTVESYIIQSNPDDEKWVYWSRGKPCNNDDFIKRDFDSIFQKTNTNAIPMSSYSSCPDGYYYLSGSIPYLIEELANYDYLLDDYTNDTNYTMNLTISAFLSDNLIWNKEQSNHDYTISRTNEIDTTNDTFFVTLVADGIVNASLNNDDSINKTWNTIQKAADNMTNLDILIVENGTYNENLILNKSIIVFGKDEETTIINGSIIMNNPHDYELLQETDQIANVNMTRVSLLMHFNNHSKVGENYSNSTNIYDYSPPNNNGTNNNASFTTSTIKGEGAFVFNGTNNSINLPSIPALLGENVTVSSWIYWKEGTNDTDTIISQSNSTQGYCLYINNSNNLPMFRLDTTSVAASGSIGEGWHNIVGTHDSTTLKIYVDGVLSNSTSKSGSGSDRFAFVGFDNVSSYFNGTIDEIAVWNRTLPSDEIYHIYDQHFGVVIDGFTIRNGNIGIRPVNHTDITNCIIQNFTTGILLENVSDIKIECNFSDCATSLSICNNNPDEFNRIRVMDCCFDGNTEGIIIYNTSNIDICRVVMNDSVTPLDINNSNFSFININNMFSAGNSSPDFPDISGPCLGDVDTNYTYYVHTNDTDDDPILFYIDWGDGNNTGWFGPLFPSYPVNKPHSWTEQGGYYIKVKAKDIFYNETSWSTPILFKTETNPPIINTVNGTYHQTFSNATVNGQWWYWKVNVSDGTNYVESGVFSFFTGYQSKIENTGSTNFTGYLLMQIEYYNTTNSTWVLEQEVVNETTPRTINGSDVLALDTIFNPYNVSTSSFTNGDGTYRIYVAFRNPDGNILVTDNETELMTTYEFTVTFD